MKTFTAVSVLGLAAVAVAQNSTNPNPVPASGACADNFAICSSSGTTPQVCEDRRNACVQNCEDRLNACRDAFATNCEIDFAQCTGQDADQNEYFTVTDVVPSYTTFCPFPTTLVENGATYVATGPTVLTITDCPCTITRTISSNPTDAANPANNAGTGSGDSGSGSGSDSGAGSSGNGTAAPYTPEAYMGGASKMIGAGLSLFATTAGFLAFYL